MNCLIYAKIMHSQIVMLSFLDGSEGSGLPNGLGCARTHRETLGTYTEAI